MTTGEKLKELRSEKGITQDKLLKELDGMITKNTLSSAENDSSKKGPSFETIKLLAKYYDVDVEYLIDDDVVIRKKEYLGIYNKLGFSEKAIKKIENLGKLEYDEEYIIPFDDIYDDTDHIKKQQKLLSSFIEKFEFSNFLYYVEELKTLVEIRKCAQDIYDFRDLALNIDYKKDVIVSDISFSSKDSRISKLIDNYDNMLEKLYNLVINYQDDYSKFEPDYYNIIEFKEYFKVFKQLAKKQDTISFFDFDFDYVLEIGIDFLADVDREINYKHYIISQEFEKYINSIIS